MPAPQRNLAEAIPAAALAPRLVRPRVDVTLDETRIVNPQIFDQVVKIRPRPIVLLNTCPAGGVHDHNGSAAYTLACDDPQARGQPDWRWCRKCQGLAYGGGVAQSRCPRGGQHDHTGSAAYTVAMNDPAAPGQPGWRWCHKCQGLAYGGGAPGPCPAGGQHDHGGSGAYAVPMNDPNAPGQTGWRWCRKCQGLAYAGDTGLSREELALPVAPGQEVTDTVTYEPAVPGTPPMHLPQYRLARRGTTGTGGYEIRFGQAPDGAPILTLRLEKQRAPQIPAGTATAELPHEILLRLTYRLVLAGGGGATKELAFQEIGETADGLSLVATLRFSGPAERDQALAAVTNLEGGAGLLITRSVRVAIPVVGSPNRFRPVTRALEQVAEPNPFFFNPDLNRDLFEGPRPGAGQLGLSPHQVAQGDRFHTYWQDTARPNTAYYLPNAFRLARRGKPAPFLPVVATRLAPGATGPENAAMVLEFVATPFTDPDRLAAARQALAAKLLPAGASPDDIVFEPLQVEKASLWMALPGAVGFTERPGALIDLRSGLTHVETLPLPAFQAVYDALMGGSVALMRGEVRVDLGSGVTDRIPFEARFDTMNGNLVEVQAAPGLAPGSFALTLTNAIESPLTVASLGGLLRAAGQDVAATIGEFSQPLPAELAPGASLSCVLTPAAPAPAEAQPVLDLDGLRVRPDAAGLWEVILDTTTPNEISRTIRVKLFPAMFEAPDGNAAEPALAVLVQFERGTTLELTPEKPEAELRLPIPIGSIVLRSAAGPSGYRYRCSVIRRSSRATDSEWREDSSDLLVPLLPKEG
ncbi:hypothetical protein H7965_22840 [Siccirubricoccus deserti]|uniref:Uncharacterized protein n=2 Tax=Siccirubricoccus deserti TaxID=2013562 RepID=A0A9X0R1W1_9PROT|nr:hypothetical protein [Siccirubricoccus deserti]